MLITKLPNITAKNQLKMMILGYVLFTVLYLSGGNIGMQIPITITPLSLDQKIPFIPEAVWVYLSQFAFLFCAIYFAPNNAIRSTAFYSMLLASIIAFFIFITFPTLLPRHLIEGNGLTAMLWHFLYQIDVERNCFPSLHAALATIATFSLAHSKNSFRYLAPLWGTAIILSTLFTKQHVVIDVSAGIMLAMLCLILYYRISKQPYEQT